MFPALARACAQWSQQIVNPGPDHCGWFSKHSPCSTVRVQFDANPADIPALFANSLDPHWKINGAWLKGPDDIVLGAEAVLVEKRKVGDKMYFPDLDAEFRVAGIIERTGSEDDGFFYLPLATTQRVFQKEGKTDRCGRAPERPHHIRRTSKTVSRPCPTCTWSAVTRSCSRLMWAGSCETRAEPSNASSDAPKVS